MVAVLCRYRPTLFHSIRGISSLIMSKTALIVLAEGAEEMECVIPADTLRRAGVKVTIAGLNGSSVVNCSRDVKIQPDESLETAMNNGPYDAVILPGGLKGSQNLVDSAVLGALLQKQELEGRVIAAICAAPTAFKKHGVGKGKRITSYPSARTQFDGTEYIYCDERVVIDGTFITSRGPGTAQEFSLAIVNQILGQEAVDNLVKTMLIKL